MFLTFSNCNRDIMKIFMYNSMETTSATRRESVFLIHEDDSEDVAGEVERPEAVIFSLTRTKTRTIIIDFR